MKMMMWYLVCLLIIHSATTINSTTNTLTSTASPDKCNIMTQAYVNKADGKLEICDPWEIGFVQINGATIWNASMCWNVYNSFGLTMFEIEPTSCRILTKETFHTSEREGDAFILVNHLRQVADGSWLIGVTGNDASNHLKFAFDALADLGVFIADVRYRGSFTFIVEKGNPKNTAANKTLDNSVEPASLNVVIAEEIITTPATTIQPTKIPRHDCADILAQGGTTSGVYTLDNGITAYCDMTTDGGGWTVFQRRQDGSLDFYRNWTEYAVGFGTPDAEFWLGNDNLYALTSAKQYKLRVDLGDFSGNSEYAEYSNFMYGSSANNYTLISVGTFSGNSGDSLTSWGNVGQQFSTYDQDHDSWHDVNCAELWHGAWWYRSCGGSNLNGQYYDPPVSDRTGVHWRFHLGAIPLKFAEMKIKPTNA